MMNFQKVYMEFPEHIQGKRIGILVPGRSKLMPLFLYISCIEFVTLFL